ncbi:MAG: Transporter, rane protein [Paenibacillaceae bacterium]|jgi:RND superfamily putative drug exporter|nr:Transporter, rane protein [Paenibacillaceae bacterium]
MKKTLNWRTLSLLAWIVITAVSLVSMPDMDQLVREKGQASIPATAQSEIARTMLGRMEETGSEKYDIIAVFHNESGTALSDNQKDKIKAAIEHLKREQSQLGILDIFSHLDSVQAANQLVSEDGSTILTRIAVSKDSGSISQVSARLNDAVRIDGVQSYLTGTDLVIEDFVHTTQEGIKKTEVIAVIFILVVLVIVFRSPVVPLISLATVGVSYLVSMGIVANLVDRLNYPFSNFTQVFLVVILFGIGTDYNILLYTRFKEELSAADDVLSAVRKTYRSAGKTVLYSGLAVFIGFIALILAEFKIYRSGSAVAVGVAVLIVVLNTLNPFFMAVLGRKMFWPVKQFEGHGDSCLWGFLSGRAVARPVIMLVLTLAVCLPFVYKYSGTLSYNDLLEIDDAYESKQGITIIGEHFPAGFSSPATLVIQTDRALDNSHDLQALDELADKVAKVQGISAVYTATRPEGKKLDALYMNDQTGQLHTGLKDAADGIGKIHNGLASAETRLAGQSQGMEDVQKLIDGTSEAQQGAVALGAAVNQLTAGINSGQAGAKELQDGLGALKEKLSGLSLAAAQLHTGYSRLEGGLSAFADSFVKLSQAIQAAENGYGQIEASMKAFLQDHPEMATDRNVQATLGVASSAKQQLSELSVQLDQLVSAYNASMNSFKQANAALEQVNEGIGQLEAGVGQLHTGSVQLHTGLGSAAGGSAQIAGRSNELASGIGQINDGQKQMLAGLNDLSANMNELKTGLAESSGGLQKVSSGLDEARDYLAGLSQSEASQKFYIPEGVLKGGDFQQALDMYLSTDRQTAQMMIILDVNPYSAEAMDIIRNLNGQVQAAVQGTPLMDAQIAIGGKSSQNADLQDIASNDFTRTAVIMLTGIGIVLVIITRSFWQPVFIIASLILAYYTSLGISDLLGTRVLDVDQLGWNVPFFGFIMIVTLGVDYSIFLMTRYRELDHSSVQSIVTACRNLGGVVISAAVILGGTFAALMPSGVLTLIEVAIVVIFGLLILSFLMLPVFIPSLMSITERLNGEHRVSKE